MCPFSFFLPRLRWFVPISWFPFCLFLASTFSPSIRLRFDICSFDVGCFLFFLLLFLSFCVLCVRVSCSYNTIQKGASRLRPRVPLHLSTYRRPLHSRRHRPGHSILRQAQGRAHSAHGRGKPKLKLKLKLGHNSIEASWLCCVGVVLCFVVSGSHDVIQKEVLFDFLWLPGPWLAVVFLIWT